MALKKRDRPCPCGADLYEIAAGVYLCTDPRWPHLLEGPHLSSPLSHEATMRLAQVLLRAQQLLETQSLALMDNRRRLGNLAVIAKEHRCQLQLRILNVRSQSEGVVEWRPAREDEAGPYTVVVGDEFEFTDIDGAVMRLIAEPVRLPGPRIPDTSISWPTPKE